MANRVTREHVQSILFTRLVAIPILNGRSLSFDELHLIRSFLNVLVHDQAAAQQKENLLVSGESIILSSFFLLSTSDMSGIFKNKKEKTGQQQTRSSPNASTNWGDEEYNKIIEGVKRVYKTKIKPLEVTYNFEGKQMTSRL